MRPLELVGGIEPPTSSLPRMRSTPELHEPYGVDAGPGRVIKKFGGASLKVTIPPNFLVGSGKSGAQADRSRSPCQKKYPLKEDLSKNPENPFQINRLHPPRKSHAEVSAASSAAISRLNRDNSRHSPVAASMSATTPHIRTG